LNIIIIMEHRKKVWLRNENYLVILYNYGKKKLFKKKTR